MKNYALKDLTAAKLAEFCTILHEPIQPEVWEELSRVDLLERERLALGLITERLLYYKAHRVNEATIWARAIYPLLVLAERGTIRAWADVPLSGTFHDVEIRGEADGALAASADEELGPPYLVVVEAKRGTSGTDPVAQLLGSLLCAARVNERAASPAREIFGCYTIADVWTFVRARLEWTDPTPAMHVLSSREYTEKTEAAIILAILQSIVSKYMQTQG